MGRASHPMRFLVFVSPPPVSETVEIDTVEIQEDTGEAPTFTTQTDTVQLVDNREEDEEAD